jgi:hypothetical protein
MPRLEARKFGNSLGVVLREAAVDHLRAGVGDPLFRLESPGGADQLTPHDRSREKEIENSEQISRCYGNAQHVLAK